MWPLGSKKIILANQAVTYYSELIIIQSSSGGEHNFFLNIEIPSDVDNDACAPTIPAVPSRAACSGGSQGKRPGDPHEWPVRGLRGVHFLVVVEKNQVGGIRWGLYGGTEHCELRQPGYAHLCYCTCAACLFLIGIVIDIIITTITIVSVPGRAHKDCYLLFQTFKPTT